METQEKIVPLRLQNNQVSVTTFYAVCDKRHNQLVAAGLVCTEKQSLQSILATLATNSDKNLTLRAPYPHHDVYLKNARKGYIKMSRNLETANAFGHVLCIEHPAAGDPRLSDFPYFYVLATEGEDVERKFVDRLNTAIAWPVRPWWSDYLIEHGCETGLIFDIGVIGPGYSGAMAAYKRDDAWVEIISAGLISGKLTLEEN